MTTEQKNAVTDIVKKNFLNQNEVKVLEAGCGSSTHIELMDHYKLIGIDISEKQLERNKKLSQKICGDIQTYPLEANLYDAIICWFVLEHLKYPQKAMENFMRALKTNGLILIAVPNIWSVKGIVTKYTPQFVHVWFYKYVAKSKIRFKEDEGPFKTFFRPGVYPGNMKKFATKNNFEIVYFEYISDNIFKNLKKMNPFIYAIQQIVGGLLWLFSFGKITQKNTEYVIVMKKL